MAVGSGGAVGGNGVLGNAVSRRLVTNPSTKIAATIQKVKDGRDNIPEDQETEPAVDVFIKAKLKEWDKDHSGRFTVEEVEVAMAQLHGTMRRLASLKLQVVACSVVLAFALILMLGAAAIALTLAKNTEVGANGALRRSGTGTNLVMAPDGGVDDLPSILSFDASSDQWSLDDAALRSLDAFSFTSNGTFYHMQIAELVRFDSGPGGDADGLDIITDGGHRLRFYEMADGFSDLEVKWRGTSMWVPAGAGTSSGGRLLEAAGGEAAEEEDDLDSVAGMVAPPPRLLSKGHYVGGVFVHRWGGSHRCDPRYIDGVHDPDQFCDGAAGTRISWLLPLAALLLAA